MGASNNSASHNVSFSAELLAFLFVLIFCAEVRFTVLDFCDLVAGLDDGMVIILVTLDLAGEATLMFFLLLLLDTVRATIPPSSSVSCSKSTEKMIF